MAQNTIAIVGTGIAGLVLGRAFRNRCIPVVLYDRNTSAPRHPYSIKLRTGTLERLLKILKIDAQTLQQICDVRTRTKNNPTPSFRVNRAKLERLLREGLSIHGDHELSDLERLQKGGTLFFKNGTHVACSFVIAADGASSKMRASALPSFKPKVLPFAVFNGKRWISKEQSDELLSHFGNVDELEERHGTVLLQTYINEIVDGKLSLSYTYSRPARSGEDPLYRPNRPRTGASEIPEDFYDEVKKLQMSGHFRTIFDPVQLREGRNLSWLMRSGLVAQEDLLSLAGSNIAFVGEAVHPLPIIGSVGANLVIRDALELAEHIGEGSLLQQYYETRFSEWKREVERSEERLKNMHSTQHAAL